MEFEMLNYEPINYSYMVVCVKNIILPKLLLKLTKICRSIVCISKLHTLRGFLYSSVV